jgi:hypothetical protein
MRAKAGDRIVIAPRTVNGTVRDGEILETRGPDGAPPYRVRWSDGHEGIIYPGVGAMTIHDAAEPAPASATAPAPSAQHQPERSATVPPSGAQETHPEAVLPRVRDWTVRVSIFEAGDDTDAHVVLLSDAPTHLTASGHSRRGNHDEPVPEIGDQVAVARALRHLADELLATVALDIEALTGERDVVVKAR